MSERVGQLLEKAVADVAPRIADPAATVVRRGRVARFRAVTASAVAVLAVAAGGVGVAARLSADPVPPPPVAALLGEPEPPRVVDGKIVAGNATIPVPPGWRVLRAGAAPCGMQENAVLLSGPDDPVACTAASIEMVSTSSTFPPGYGLPATEPSPHASGPRSVSQVIKVAAPHMLTLADGEPAWLLEETASQRGKANYYNQLVLPWSQLTVTLRVDGVAQQSFIDSIRTTPRRTTRLALPATATAVMLTGPPQPSGERDYARSTDATTVAAVLRLLERQTHVVDDRHACASQAHPTARLAVEEIPSTRPTAFPAPSAMEAVHRGTTWVIIGLGDNCREAVSSRGGRVRLDEAAYRELLTLMGIGAR